MVDEHWPGIERLNVIKVVNVIKVLNVVTRQGIERHLGMELRPGIVKENKLKCGKINMIRQLIQ